MNDLNNLEKTNSKYFLAPYNMLTPEIIDKVKLSWKNVATYTVNETWDFQTIIDMWVNIIMTDKIDLLKEYNKL